MNKVLMTGNLTRNPELRYTPSGTAVCDFGIANNRRMKNKSGEPIERVTFIDITAWGRQAETCGEYLSKGSRVLVDGELEMDQWDDSDGNRRSKLKIRAVNVEFISTKDRAPDNHQSDEDDDPIF